MTIKFPYINLPYSFTRVLQINMNSGKSSYEELAELLNENPGLLSSIQNFYHHIDSDGRISKIVTNIGWDNFRNGVGALIIYRSKNDHYPKKYHPSILTPILSFEEKLRPYSVTGFSRAFLLGWYFLTCNESEIVSKFNNQSLLSHKLLSIMKFSKTRTIKIDWLILSLIHFEMFFDPGELSDLVEAGVGHHDLYDQLTKDQKLYMMNNFLSYGSSIGDKDIFLEQRL